MNEATNNNHEHYDPVFFKRLAGIEDQHFWFQTRNRVIASMVQQLTASLSPGYRVLEVGCGTGNTLRVLEQACPTGSVVGMDLFAGGLHFAQERVGCSLVQGNMRTAPFQQNQFAIIGLFDVLEHFSDDVQVLRDLHPMLTDDGVVLLTVPAHASLWSYFDESSCHYRRYAPAELTRKFHAAGYTVSLQMQYMASIFPLVWVGRRLAARQKAEQTSDYDHALKLTFDELRIVPVVNEVLAWVLALEVRLIAKGYRLPFGTSLLAAARKVAR